VRHNLARLQLTIGDGSAALTFGETALAAHTKLLGPNHPWTKDSARVTADALDALGRTEEAKALRERMGSRRMRRRLREAPSWLRTFPDFRRARGAPQVCAARSSAIGQG
jgi:hypothetical protein